MNKIFIPIILVIVSTIGCQEQSKKQYEDYNEKDFTEVQGIVIRVEQEFAYQSRKIDVTYIYNLDKEVPDIGYEEDNPFIALEGQPAIILVHKDLPNITFYGGSGYLDEQEEILNNYLKKCEEIGGYYYGVDYDAVFN
ncbi:hypothetical protein [Muricauda sp. MAR_2010_75]|uniref:hypothetical protein n=1 Tax=Allomuricauda sp. MAR_2010_75 TaxID=1250232 RepID=UPI0012E0500E|nr:hypothetical protein [Muricauda sp. MAR_2010_75]